MNEINALVHVVDDDETEYIKKGEEPKCNKLIAPCVRSLTHLFFFFILFCCFFCIRCGIDRELSCLFYGIVAQINNIRLNESNASHLGVELLDPENVFFFFILFFSCLLLYISSLFYWFFFTVWLNAE